jgi:hypothetical protein
MKSLLLFAIAIALPAGILSKASAELERLVEPNLLKAPTLQEGFYFPGLGAKLFIQRLIGSDLKEFDDTAASMTIHGNVALPFTKEEMDDWINLVDAHIEKDTLGKQLLPEDHATKHYPNGNHIQDQLYRLMQYVKESQKDSLGRVRVSTHNNAKRALLELITTQYRMDKGRTKSYWGLPKFAKLRLNEMMAKEEGKTVAKIT